MASNANDKNGITNIASYPYFLFLFLHYYYLWDRLLMSADNDHFTPLIILLWCLQWTYLNPPYVFLGTASANL